MKPTSPLSLLLFISLTTSAPIPTIQKLPKDCLHYTTCQSWLREAFSPSENGHTPPTRLTTPHFPSHQSYPPSSSAEAHRAAEQEAFDNSPITPPSDQPPSIALAATRPLQSSYLLSLSHLDLKEASHGEPVQTSQSTTSADALPSKPTSSLPKLREEDTLRYLATVASDVGDQKVEAGVGSDEIATLCGNLRGVIGRTGQPVMAREYSDLLVVAIVVLFLAAVVIMEAVEYYGELRAAKCCRSTRGAIFLADDQKASTLRDDSMKSPTCSIPTQEHGEDEKYEHHE